MARTKQTASRGTHAASMYGPNVNYAPAPVFEPTTFGLYNLETNTLLPLTKIDIDVNITNNVATSQYTVVFLNDLPKSVECELSFLIPPMACLNSFQAQYESVTINGEIRPKNPDHLHEESKEDAGTNNPVIYSSVIGEESDTMRLKIGSIPSQKEVTIVYSILHQLDITMNKFWKYTLSTTILNTHDQSNLNIVKLADYPVVTQFNPKMFPWTFRINIASTSPINFLDSPSHEIFTNYANDSRECVVTLRPDKLYTPKEDFVLVFSDDNVHKPSCQTSSTDEHYCSMITLFPQLITVSNEDAYKALKGDQVNLVEHSVRRKAEFIFLLDRSGSMSGIRIEKAKEALVFFLKSLPESSFFNIVSFGSGFECYQPQSVGTTDANINEAIGEIEEYDADMGGTQILQPLQAVVAMLPNYTPSGEQLQRIIFLLTDGDVNNSEDVLKLIDESAQHSQVRVFSVGIGNGCSTSLVQQAAFLGKGNYRFVQDNQDVSEKVITLLEKACSPICENFDLTLSHPEAVDFIVPDPKSLHFVLMNEPVTFFVFFKKALVTTEGVNLKFSLFNGADQETQLSDLTINFSETLQKDTFIKMGMYYLIKIIDDKQKKGQLRLKITGY